MLPDFGWSELLVIAIVLIVIVGPKDLPKMLRTFGKTTSSLRKMAGDFRRQFDDALKEAELDDVRQLSKDLKSIDPRGQIKDALNPLGKLGEDLNEDLKKATKDIETPAWMKDADTGKSSDEVEAPAVTAKKPKAAKPKTTPAKKPATAKAGASKAASSKSTSSKPASSGSKGTKAATAKAPAAKTSAKAPASKAASSKAMAAKPAAARTAKSSAGTSKPAAKPKAKAAPKTAAAKTAKTNSSGDKS